MPVSSGGSPQSDLTVALADHPVRALRHGSAKGSHAPPVSRRRSVVLPYGRNLPARKRPASTDTVTARRVLVDGLAATLTLRAGKRACAAAPAGQHPPRRGVPPPRRGRAGLVPDQPGRPAAPGGTTRAIPYRAHFPRPAKTPSSSTRCCSQRPSGAGPNRTCWTRSPGGRPDEFSQYALFAAVAYIRAAASRAGVPVRQACQDLAQRPDHPAP
jgi:hypothetical protein